MKLSQCLSMYLNYFYPLYYVIPLESFQGSDTLPESNTEKKKKKLSPALRTWLRGDTPCLMVEYVD